MEIETRLANKKILIEKAHELNLKWIRTYAERRRTLYTVKFYLIFFDEIQELNRLNMIAESLGSYNMIVKKEKGKACTVYSVTFHFKYNNHERRI